MGTKSIDACQQVEKAQGISPYRAVQLLLEARLSLCSSEGVCYQHCHPWGVASESG